MVYEFEFQRPSYYNSRLFSSYYPTSKSSKPSPKLPYNIGRYYKPYWSYSPYIPYPSSYPYPYSSSRYNYLYNLPNYSYRYINPKLPSLSEILARKEIDRFKNCARSKCVEVELDNFNFGSYNESTERLKRSTQRSSSSVREIRETRASSVPRFIRESSLEPSFNIKFLRSSLEREFF